MLSDTLYVSICVESERQALGIFQIPSIASIHLYHSQRDIPSHMKSHNLS